MTSTPLHSLRSAEVYRVLETSPNGLPISEVEARRSLYGENLLSEPLQPSTWSRLVVHIIHPMALLLLFAGLLAFLVAEPVLGLVIWGLVLINAGFSFWREYRAEQAMEALHKRLPSYARVLRENNEIQVPASEIVPGDVLVLAEGDNIPADARVVEEYGLRINNSTLTGEAVPARKTSDASFAEGISELERPNLVFAGTSVVSGTGRAIVYGTGMLTQFGRIAHLTQAVAEEPSHLQQELVRLTRIITIVALALGGIIFSISYFDLNIGLFEAFLLALGVIAAAIPEGLPAIITLSLAMAGQRLAQQGALVKKLSVIETLGTISVICTDKSGTLTQNQMTVREVWVSGKRIKISGVGYEPKGKIIPVPEGQPFEADLDALLMAAALCNNSRLTPPSSERPGWSGLGDQTEVALRVAARKGGLDEHNLNLLYPRIHENPFDARRKRMSTIHRDSVLNDERSLVTFVKGAPREVLQLCTHILIHGEVKPLTNELRSEILAANDDYARRALRVLALARRTVPTRHGSFSSERVENNLTFIGLMAMMDPPRPEVAEAVETCRQAGIRMVMITGDYGLTAESLARRVGMLSTNSTIILTGAELDRMSDPELHELLTKEVIFARMAPEHKLRLVSAFQQRGEVVVVTGDGVNDAPALRKANVGVAMGVIGTDVAKEAADIVLTNDNFASIVRAIEEGRAVYDNIRKFITYIFASNVPEFLPFMFTAVFGIPLALMVKQILAIDLGTDIMPALALGTEKPEPDVMRRPPRRLDKPLIDGVLLARAFLWLGPIEAALCYLGFFFVLNFLGEGQILEVSWMSPLVESGLIPAIWTLPKDQIYILAVTTFHAGVVTAQAGNAFACRSETQKGRRLGWFSNPLLWLGVLVEIYLIFLLIYARPLARAFDHLPLPYILWVGLFLYAPVLYNIERVRKSLVGWFHLARNHKENRI